VHLKKVAGRPYVISTEGPKGPSGALYPEGPQAISP